MFVVKDTPQHWKAPSGRYEILIDDYSTQVGSAEERNPKELEFIVCVTPQESPWDRDPFSEGTPVARGGASKLLNNYTEWS